jgi:hypothetical protein
MRDAKEKRRIAHGEMGGTSKLTEKQVLRIRASKDKTSILMERYGISRSQVKRIRAGTTWSHLNSEN